jgi:hypothetical protein
MLCSGHSGPVWALKAHDNLLISAGSDEMIKAFFCSLEFADATQIWDLNTFDCIRTLEGHTG